MTLRAQRAAAQLLGGATTDPPAIVRHLLAVQAQDLRAAKLALRARGTGFTAADVDALLASGELVITWLLRGTLHLVAREDLAWLHTLCAPRQRAANDRRLAQLGLDPARADELVALLPATRAEIASALGLEGQQTPHLIWRAAIDGRLVSTGTHYVPAAIEPVDRDEARARLATRYLTAHAPADATDLAHWSGLPLRDTRTQVRTELLHERGRSSFMNEDGAAQQSGTEPVHEEGRSRFMKRDGAGGSGRRRVLLPVLDEYLLGWKDRGFAVPGRLAKEVHPGGGIVRAVAVEDGLVVGTWTAGAIPEGFEEEGADVARFLSR